MDYVRSGFICLFVIFILDYNETVAQDLDSSSRSTHYPILIVGNQDSLPALSYTRWFDHNPAFLFLEQQSSESLQSLIDDQLNNLNTPIIFANRGFNDLIIDLARKSGELDRRQSLFSSQFPQSSSQRSTQIMFNNKGEGKVEIESKGVYEIWIRSRSKALKDRGVLSVGDYVFSVEKSQGGVNRWIKIGTGEFNHGIHKATVNYPDIDFLNAFVHEIEMIVISQEQREKYEGMLRRARAVHLFHQEQEQSPTEGRFPNKADFYIPHSGNYDVTFFIRPKRESVKAFAMDDRFAINEMGNWKKENHETPVFVFGENFYPPERLSYSPYTTMWRGMLNNGDLLILNPFNSILKADLFLYAFSFGMDRNIEVYFNNQHFTMLKIPKVANNGLSSELKFKDLSLLPGINKITFKATSSAIVPKDNLKLPQTIAINELIKLDTLNFGSNLSFWKNPTVSEVSVSDGALTIKGNYSTTHNEISWISRRIDKINLNDYPLFTIKYAWQNSQIQEMDIGFRIDTDDDGHQDIYLTRMLPDPIPGLNQYRIDLLESVSENTDAILNPTLVGIDLFPHNKWGVDASKSQVGIRQLFTIKNVQIASKEASVAIKGKGSFNKIKFYGSGSYSVDQNGDVMSVFQSIGGRKGRLALSEATIPIIYQKDSPLIVLPYKVDSENIQDLKAFVSYNLNKDGKADKIVPVGRRMPIGGWKLLTRDMGESMLLYETTLPSSFPTEYTTEGKRFHKFHVLKNGTSLSPTWGDDFRITREQVQVEDNIVKINLPRGTDPDDFSYEVFYLPKDWVKESSWFHGFKELVFDMRELEEGFYERGGVLVNLKLVLESKKLEGMENEEIYGFTIKAPRYVNYVLPKLNNIPVKFNMPVIMLDDQPLEFNKLRVDDGEGGVWLRQTVSLKEGDHYLRVANEGALEVYVAEIKPIISSQIQVASNPFEKPQVTFKKINPTRYIVDVKDTRGSFTLVFSESFHDGWRAYIKKIHNQRNEPWSALWSAWQDWGQRIEVKDHFVVNGYANGWFVDPAVAGSHQSFEMVLEYKPQRLFEIGVMISSLTLLGSICYLGYFFVRGRKRVTTTC